MYMYVCIYNIYKKETDTMQLQYNSSYDYENVHCMKNLNKITQQ